MVHNVGGMKSCRLRAISYQAEKLPERKIFAVTNAIDFDGYLMLHLFFISY